MNDIDHVELWKMRKLIKNLSSAKGNGTSMITLALPPDKSLPYVNSMLTNEYGTATNIKSRVNKLSVLSAITSTQNKLKQYKSKLDIKDIELCLKIDKTIDFITLKTKEKKKVIKLF